MRAPVFPSPSSTQRRRRRAKTTTAKARDAFCSFFERIIIVSRRAKAIDFESRSSIEIRMRSHLLSKTPRLCIRKKNEEEEEKKEARKQKRTVWRRLSSARSRGRIGRQQFGSRRTLLLVLCLCVYLKVRTSLHVTLFCVFFG